MGAGGGRRRLFLLFPPRGSEAGPRLGRQSPEVLLGRGRLTPRGKAPEELGCLCRGVCVRTCVCVCACTGKVWQMPSQLLEEISLRKGWEWKRVEFCCSLPCRLNNQILTCVSSTIFSKKEVAHIFLSKRETPSLGDRGARF